MRSVGDYISFNGKPPAEPKHGWYPVGARVVFANFVDSVSVLRVRYS